jgi:hypothetical protein
LQEFILITAYPARTRQNDLSLSGWFRMPRIKSLT